MRRRPGSLPTPHFVFAYGSLAARAGGEPSQLRGYRREWNVAMDNAVTLAGYKYYVDPGSGERPDLAVAFLNLVPCPTGVVNGTLLAVDTHLLAELDARERNYRRLDVSAHISPVTARRVHTYFGAPAAVARFRSARAAGRAVVSAAYHDEVLAGFARMGQCALERFHRTTRPPTCPRRALRRVDVPAGAGLPR